MNSALYVGRLSHVRRVPRSHSFAYRLYMFYLDLDELPNLRLGPLWGTERARPLSFRRGDYLGDAARPLKEAVLDRVETALGDRPAGPVCLLTQVRSLGYVFNPVSFYYCFDTDGTTLRAVLAEITNTPWKERHAYVLPARDGKVDDSFQKAFHVSPFFPMEQRYRWSMSAPLESLEVDMRNDQGGREVFRAHLVLQRRSLTPASVLRAAFGFPLMAWKVHLAIYVQALRLWLKKTPFFTHPRKRPSVQQSGS